MSKTQPMVWLYALVVALITSLPYGIGAVNTPQGNQYTGAALIPAGISVDYNSHLAKMWQGRRGQFDYHILFTHEDHVGVPLVQGFYVALGMIPLDLPLVYHAARFALTFGMVIALWRFGSRYFDDSRGRWMFLLFSTLLTGAGWLLLFLAPMQAAEIAPIEFWLIDAYNTVGALFMPHFAAAVICQTGAVLVFEGWLAGGRTKSLVALTFYLAALSILQPYVILLTVPLISLVTIYRLANKRTAFSRALWLIIPIGIHAALITYQYFSLNADPIWREFAAQNITQSPPPIYYLLGYLPFFLPIVFGWRSFRASAGDIRLLLPMLWVIIVAVLLYAPIVTQRRFLLGVQTPLAVLAAWGWLYITRHWKPPRRSLITSIYVLFGAIPLLLLIATNIGGVLQQPRAAYMSRDEQLGYAWLGREADPDEVVLTTFEWSGEGSGGRLVSATGFRVYIGHWIETAHFDEKIENIQHFYNPDESDAWRCGLLRNSGISYVWYDGHAREIGSWNPDEAAYLTADFSSETVTIFRVLVEECSSYLSEG
jgi:hypothetical protein